MTSEDIMEVALDLAQLTEIPGDSGIHVRSDSVREVFATIDCDVSDLLLARELKCDTVLTHHPEGTAALNGWRVMRNQIEQMVECGVPVAKAEAALQRRMQQVELNSHARNYGRVVQAARLLKLAFLNVHVPCDVITRRLIAERLARFNDPEEPGHGGRGDRGPSGVSRATGRRHRSPGAAGRRRPAGGPGGGGHRRIHQWRRGRPAGLLRGGDRHGADDALPRGRPARGAGAATGRQLSSSPVTWPAIPSASTSTWTSCSGSASRSSGPAGSWSLDPSALSDISHTPHGGMHASCHRVHPGAAVGVRGGTEGVPAHSLRQHQVRAQGGHAKGRRVACRADARYGAGARGDPSDRWAPGGVCRLAARGRETHGPHLRPLRRPAGRAAGTVDDRRLRSDRPERRAFRPRRRGRQGPGVHALEGPGGPPEDRRSAARQRPAAHRGRGRDRQPELGCVHPAAQGDAAEPTSS